MGSSALPAHLSLTDGSLLCLHMERDLFVKLSQVGRSRTSDSSVQASALPSHVVGQLVCSLWVSDVAFVHTILLQFLSLFFSNVIVLHVKMLLLLAVYFSFVFIPNQGSVLE